MPLRLVSQLLLWAGLWDLLVHTRPFLEASARGAPGWAVDGVCGVVGLGAALNAYWFVKIVRVATAGGPLTERSKRAHAMEAADEHALERSLFSKGGALSPAAGLAKGLASGLATESDASDASHVTSNANLHLSSIHIDSPLAERELVGDLASDGASDATMPTATSCTLGHERRAHEHNLTV